MDHYLTSLFFILICLNLLAKLYLSFRNRSHILKHRPAVPSEFASKIELTDHQKAADYSATKSRFGSLSLLFNTALLLILLPWGLAQKFYQLAAGYHSNEIIQGLIFFSALSVFSTILSLPWDLYSTFVIEEKFGFNKMTLGLYFKDMIKQTLLGVIIGLPFLAVIIKLMTSLGSLWWLYAWGFMMGFQLLMLWLYPTLIAPLFNKFSPLEEGELTESIQELLNRVGFKSKGLFSMNASMRSSHGNAYFTGFGKNKRIVFFDTLLEQLSAPQVIAVLAHELGHFKKKHILKTIIISSVVLLGGFYLLGQFATMEVFYQAHFFQVEVNGGMGPSYIALYLFTTLIPLYTYFFTPISTWFSRRNEFEADQFAAENADANELINALVQMYKDNASSLTPDPLFSKFYYSHPPAKERVEFLKSLS